MLGGVPGVNPARVVILGGGVVGRNAAMMAVGMGAEVAVIDRNIDVLRGLVDDFGTRIKTVFSTRAAIEQNVGSADLVVGGVLIPGPTHMAHGVVHYCVANMPGAVARTSTFALSNATLPFVLALADKGYAAALAEDPHLLAGLNVHCGSITCESVATALGYDYVALAA